MGQLNFKCVDLILNIVLISSFLLFVYSGGLCNLPPSPPPSPAAEHFGPLDQGRVTLLVCMERGEVRNTLKELEQPFSYEYFRSPSDPGLNEGILFWDTY